MNDVALHTDHLDLISLCTGGAGLDLGIGLAIPGARSVVMVEREAFAVAHLVAAMEQGLLHPAPVWSDVRSFDGRRWRGCVDGVIGGIPCQPHSLAGQKQGSLDERDLWADARRTFVQSRAWFILIENVGGMLSAGADEIAGAERVWRDLHKLGCTVEAGLFTASEVGASHERERVFILGVADAEGNRDSGGAREPGASPRPVELSAGGHRGLMADASDPRLQGAERGRSSGQRDGPQASRPASEFRGTPVAHADDRVGQQHAGQWPDAGERGQAPSERAHSQPAGSGRAMVNAARDRWREGRPEPGVRRGRDAASGAGLEMVDADRPRRQAAGAGRPLDARQQSQPGRGYVGDTDIAQFRRQPPAGELAQLQYQYGIGEGLGLFPPGPGDRENWQAILERAPELEPSFRRVADGLASRLDFARVDRLRLLGNGVVCLQAAYALRVLATRLAARGSPGAARLVRLMEAA